MLISHADAFHSLMEMLTPSFSPNRPTRGLALAGFAGLTQADITGALNCRL